MNLIRPVSANNATLQYMQSLTSKAARAMIVNQILVELIDLLWELAHSLSALMV